MSNSTSDVLLVGGGLGSINARFYASFYENIFGVVLINPFHESTFMDKDWDMSWYEHFIPSLQMEQLSAAFGLNRLGIITGLYKSSILKEGHFDNEVLIRLKHLSCSSQHLSAGVMEHYYMEGPVLGSEIAPSRLISPSNPVSRHVSFQFPVPAIFLILFKVVMIYDT